MFKKLSSSFLIVSACIFSSCTPTVKQEIAILPTPVSLTEQSGSFVLKDGMKIGVSDQSLFPAAGYLQEILRNVISSSVEVTTDKSQVDMYFQLKDTVGKPSSYKLESTPEYIRVEATDYSGIISAITTIRQLLPATIEVQGEKQTYSIPVVQIEDAPRFEWRGFMLDASIGKYIRLRNGKSISLNLSLTNILNNTDLRTGGFEQNRDDNYKDGDARVYKFSKNSKYFYAFPFNAFLNIGYRF